MAGISAPPPVRVQPGSGSSCHPRRRFLDQGAFLVTFASAVAIVIVTAMVFYQLYSKSAASRQAFGWSFLTSSAWDPVNDTFGAAPFIFGTLVTSGIALLIAVPVGLGAAIFLAELAPRRLSNVLTFLVELLAAVPSVIIGLLGIFVLLPVLRDYVVPPVKAVFGFLPIFEGPFYGVSLLSAGVLLSIMIAPFIISVSREVLIAVPRDIREASFGLGATQWETTWKAVVPYARHGIFGSIFLAMARAFGETMAVTMVVGNTPKIQSSLLAPGYSIAAVIANEFTEATGDAYLSAIIELALVLFVLTIIVNGLARLLIFATSGKGTQHV